MMRQSGTMRIGRPLFGLTGPMMSRAVGDSVKRTNSLVAPVDSARPTRSGHENRAEGRASELRLTTAKETLAVKTGGIRGAVEKSLALARSFGGQQNRTLNSVSQSIAKLSGWASKQAQPILSSYLHFLSRF
jgi:hypothetical protein